jgi:hypothetical protein
MGIPSGGKSSILYLFVFAISKHAPFDAYVEQRNPLENLHMHNLGNN